MITRSEVARREVIYPTTPAEREVFTCVLVGPEGARLLRHARPTEPAVALAIGTSAQAAVLEELGRMLRIRLREQEQSNFVHPHVEIPGTEPGFAPANREAQGCAPTIETPGS